MIQAVRNQVTVIHVEHSKMQLKTLAYAVGALLLPFAVLALINMITNNLPAPDSAERILACAAAAALSLTAIPAALYMIYRKFPIKHILLLEATLSSVLAGILAYVT
ncbi:MAG: hypothetical protein K2W82_12560 [Candidatus Obscuribacterales bacterium]|jgi:hypothetical protein|nr:hypothetical protein [Candidatus Obscuribacterales bacterium]